MMSERGIMSSLLAPDEKHPAELINEAGTSPVFLVCEHASNRLPKNLGTLGLQPADLQRHIAYDIGAEGVSRLLAKLLNAPLVLQRYSRLAYDCNRSPEHPGAMPEVSEVFEIPGNKGLSPDQRLARITSIYRPFHESLAAALDRRAAHAKPTLFVTIHSFTKIYLGKTRDVELGLLFDRDSSLANMLAKSFPGIVTRLNEPYSAKEGVRHKENLHAATRGLPNIMIEIRNDLIATERGQQEWAQRLSVALNHLAKKDKS
jgi:predicted N-formylglutamate amidohydrolase